MYLIEKCTKCKDGKVYFYDGFGKGYKYGDCDKCGAKHSIYRKSNIKHDRLSGLNKNFKNYESE